MELFFLDFLVVEKVKTKNDIAFLAILMIANDLYLQEQMQKEDENKTLQEIIRNE